MLYKILYPFAKIYWRIFKPITFGVRVILIKNNQILLVQHTYLPGWMLPGGTVKFEEDFKEAAQREIKEELNLEIKNLRFFGIYKMNLEGKRDHIFVFICDELKNTSQLKIDKKEISDSNFFNLNKLPPQISPGHLRRIEEYKSKSYPNYNNW